MSHTMTVTEAEKLIEKAKKVGKLFDNPLFIELVVEDYSEGEAARIASAVTDFSLQDEIDQRELYGQLRAIGYLQNYFREVIRQGNSAADQIENNRLEAEAEEARIRESMNEVDIDPITGDECKVED